MHAYFKLKLKLACVSLALYCGERRTLSLSTLFTLLAV